jgi:RHS repeat-associated protein
MTTGTYTAQYNLTDHLGNVRSVVSSSGTVLQSTDYYPFGLAFSDSNIASNRYLYNGKELEDYTLGTSYLGTLDYSARHYDPRIARWTVPDPMAEKYYGVNAYGYCAGDPVNLVDLMGNDIWEVNKQGEVITRKHDTNQDAFFIVAKDDDGQYKRIQRTDDSGNMIDVSISFEKGTIKENSKTIRTINSKGDVSSKQLTIFEVRGDDNATQLFEFMESPLETTNVEWTHAKIGTEESGRNIVGTSHSNTSTLVGHYLRQTGYTLREVNHNHPDGDGRPSKGDKEGAREYHKNNSNTLLNVYIHPGHYIRYNQYGEIIR